MSSAAPKRARSRRNKPQPVKLSFGSSSGPSCALPSTMEASFSELVEKLQMKRQEAQVEDEYGCYLEDANGNVTGWSAHKYYPQDFETDSPEDFDYEPNFASGQEAVGHHLDDGSGDATGGRQDIELDRHEAVENGTDSAGMEEEEEDDPAVVAGDAKVLTEADMADIIRRCRAFLEEQGPSQEEELCCQEVLGPHRVELVQASIGSLTDFLARQPGFEHLREGDLFFVYVDPEVEAGDEPALLSSTDSGLLSDDSPEDGPAKARGVAQGDGPQSGHVSPCGSSSPSHSSFVSAPDDFLEELEEKRGRDGCTQTVPARREEAPCCCSCQGHIGQKDTHDRHTQTSRMDTTQLVEQELRLKENIRVLQAKIASLEDDHDREIRELRLAFEGLLQQCRCRQPPLSPLPPPPPPEEQPPSHQEVANGCATTDLEEEAQEEGAKSSQFTRPVGPDNVLSNSVCPKKDGAEDGSQAGSSFRLVGGVRTVLNGVASTEGAVHTEEEQGESPSEPVAKPIQAEAENGGHKPNARGRSPRVPDFAELHWRLEHSKRASSCADLDSSAREASPCGSTCSTARSKSEAQMAKIVMQIKQKLPHCSEADIRKQLAHVRQLQGGFSCMTIKDIVALALSYIRQNGEN
ncbi:uncharacterized protein LOC144166802 [Haemaphysalis longicornis]